MDQSPPLRGHLRLVGYAYDYQWQIAFAHELPNGINFRSVELDGFFGTYAQHILEACAQTLQTLTLAHLGLGARKPIHPVEHGRTMS